MWPCASIERCANRRYTTYWSAYLEVIGAAQSLCQKRDSQVISGMGADEFFSRLLEKVTLREMDVSLTAIREDGGRAAQEIRCEFPGMRSNYTTW